MKKTTLLLSAFLFTSSLSMAQAKWPLAATSPKQIIYQDLGSGKIEISYSRPSVKGRTVFGDVVPFDKVWRTGANAATTISFGDETTINGMKIGAGKYGLLTIPGKTDWTIIITKDTAVNNANNYKQENDLLRIPVKAKTLSSKVETFTIDINNIKATEAEIFLRWDKTEVSFKLTVNFDAKALAFIEEQMKGEEKDRPYYNAASYYYDNGKDLNKALEWVNKAIEAKPDAFFIIHLKAKIQNKLGDKNNRQQNN